MKKCMKIIFKIPLYIIPFLLLISTAGCSSSGKVKVMPSMQKPNFTPKEHQIVVAETRTLDKFLNVNALVSYGESEALSFKINNCNLKAVYVKTGDQVEKGQLLAELDSSDLEYQISERQIDLEKIQLIYDRIRNEQDMAASDKKTELESLKLDMKSIELDINHIKDLISRTKLTAPFSGTISDIKSIPPGTTVLSYDKFMTIWKPGSVVLVSEILNTYGSAGSIDLSGIVTGMKVVLIYGSKDTYTEIPATISKIVSLDPGVQENPNRILSAPMPVQLYVEPDGSYDDKLFVDHSMTLRINTGTLENVVVLPNTAIRGYGADHLVKVLIGDKIITRSITIGYEDKEENIVVVTSGLRPGESVVQN